MSDSVGFATTSYSVCLFLCYILPLRPLLAHVNIECTRPIIVQTSCLVLLSVYIHTITSVFPNFDDQFQILIFHSSFPRSVCPVSRPTVKIICKKKLAHAKSVSDIDLSVSHDVMHWIDVLVVYALLYKSCKENQNCPLSSYPVIKSSPYNNECRRCGGAWIYSIATLTNNCRTNLRLCHTSDSKRLGVQG